MPDADAAAAIVAFGPRARAGATAPDDADAQPVAVESVPAAGTYQDSDRVAAAAERIAAALERIADAFDRAPAQAAGVESGDEDVAAVLAAFDLEDG